jgi:hypothetical protein
MNAPAMNRVPLVVAALVVGYLGIRLVLLVASEVEFWDVAPVVIIVIGAVFTIIYVVVTIALIVFFGWLLFLAAYLGALLVLTLGAAALRNVLHPRKAAARRREREQAAARRREREQAEREEREREQAERERRDQELLDSIRVDVISVSNTEAVVSMNHTMPDSPDLQVLSVSYDVSFLANGGERVGWEYGEWWIFSWEHEETVKRRVLDDSEPRVTSCDVKITSPQVTRLD